MSIILFILILGALIFFHELGHFLLAKKNDIRVDEFALGFPPTIFSYKKGETRYCLNSIPFGGYVKIFGENPDEASLDPLARNSFVNKSRWVQAMVLAAGVVFNLIFAWLLFIIVLVSGMPAVLTDENSLQIQNPQIYIMDVYADSPASRAGLIPGDKIMAIGYDGEIFHENLEIETVQKTIANSSSEIFLDVSRKGQISRIEIIPQDNILGEIKAIGISMDMIGLRKIPFYMAAWEAGRTTVESTAAVFRGLGTIFGGLFTGRTNLDQVSGPIGIVGLVKNAAQFGWINLLSFTAILSINLAVLNIMPFPALDGGRLLFLAYEGITKKRIKPAFANLVNTIGFVILVAFMVAISVSDVLKFF